MSEAEPCPTCGHPLAMHVDSGRCLVQLADGACPCPEASS